MNLPPRCRIYSVVVYVDLLRKHWPWVYDVEWEKPRHRKSLSNLNAMPVRNKCMPTRCFECQEMIPTSSMWDLTGSVVVLNRVLGAWSIGTHLGNVLRRISPC